MLPIALLLNAFPHAFWLHHTHKKQLSLA
jgi:hypothetical protein